MSSNGYLTEAELTVVQSPIKLSTGTAAAWFIWRSASGSVISIAKPDGGYRTWATQVDMRVHPGAHNLNPNSTAGIAAPGISKHGLGICVDVVGNLPWAIANGARYGFTRPFGNSDPNHFQYGGAAYGNQLASIGADYVKKLQIALAVSVDGVPGPETTKAVQTKIGTPADGVWGPASTKALQTFTGAVSDGIWGNETTAKFKAAIDAGKFGAAATGAQVVKDALGANYVKKLQTQLAIIADGIVGDQTLKAIQVKVGVTADGVFGKASVTALQVFVGSPADGIWGAATTTAVKAAIDATKFGTATPTPTLPKGYVYGIDVAYPQNGVFDWAKAHENNHFVIIKLAGGDNPKPNQLYGPANLADQHLAGARAAGFRVGFYFFNNGTLSVADQVKKFVETLKPRIQAGDVVALDVEADGPNTTQFTPAQVLEFATAIDVALGMKTYIYINRSTMNIQDWTQVAAAGHPLWLAVLDGLATSLTVTTKYWTKPSIVQFEVGKIEGYAGQIDRNFATPDTFASHGYQPPTDEPEVPTDPPVGIPAGDVIEQFEAIKKLADDGIALIS